MKGKQTDRAADATAADCDLARVQLTESAKAVLKYRTSLASQAQMIARYRRANAGGECPDRSAGAGARVSEMLARSIIALPLDHPLLVECHKFEIIQWEGDPDDALWHAFHDAFLPGRFWMFERYGQDFPADGNAEWFLEEYFDLIMGCARAAFLCRFKEDR